MAKTKTIFRTDGKNRSYTNISNKLLQDKSVGWDVRGMLCDLLSRPSDWEISVGGLIAMTKTDGKAKAGKALVWRLVREAIEAGYMAKTVVRDESGRIAAVCYVVSDDPEYLREMAPAADEPRTDFRCVDTASPYTDLQCIGEQCIADQPQQTIHGTTLTMKEQTNLCAENGQQLPAKKYKVRPMGVELEDVQSLVQDVIKALDLDWVLAGGALFHDGAYPELLEIMDKYGHANTEAAIVGYLRAVAAGSRHMRRGGIRSWKYFDKVVADYVDAARKAEEKRLRDEIMSELLY